MRGTAAVLLRHPDNAALRAMTSATATELSAALGIGAFAEKTLVAAGQCTCVDPAARPRWQACSARCHGRYRSRSTPERLGRGDSVAVIGCGGVETLAVAGGRVLAGAHTIIAVDVEDRSSKQRSDSGPPTPSTPRARSGSR